MFGYGFTFGESFINPFIGVGDYFFDPEREHGSSPDKVSVWVYECPITRSITGLISFSGRHFICVVSVPNELRYYNINHRFRFDLEFLDASAILFASYSKNL